MKCVVGAVLNNDSVEFTDEYSPSDIMQALYQRGWVISPEEQVCSYFNNVIQHHHLYCNYKCTVMPTSHLQQDCYVLSVSAV